MAQLRNTFVKSKMNKDLDARLLKNDEYREGRNVNISRSEGADVGALENVKGNKQIAVSITADIEAALTTNEVPKIIGLFPHQDTRSLYIFITTWEDASVSGLDNKFKGHNWVIQVTRSASDSEVYNTKILLQGRYLNFSKNKRILGFNILENQMFWTDDRNQPRKINIEKAYVEGISILDNPTSDSAYYYTEDQISVAKYAPIEAIKFTKNVGSPAAPNWQPTWKNETEKWLPISLTAPIGAVSGTPTVLDFASAGSVPGQPQWNPGSGNISDYVIKTSTNDWPVIKLNNFTRPNAGSLYVYEVSGDVVKVAASTSSLTTQVDVTTSWVAGDIITFQLLNPEYDSTFTGDREFLKDKFVRFSYRFKYDDNEYSLMAPFTQPLFVPKQYGSFTIGDEENAAKNSIISWFENSINSAGLNIILPDTTYQEIDISSKNTLKNRFKIKEIEILFKSSSDNNVYSIDTIEIDSSIPGIWRNNIVTNGYTTYPYNSQLLYEYKGSKPFQVLPERDITRVSDATPVRAASQEVSANRVMYGNYLNNHGAPQSLDYECSVGAKNSDYNEINNPPISSSDNTLVKEYYNGTIKQGRTYQIGVVLGDRYGRQSRVILANNDLVTSGSTVRDKATIYTPYDGVGASPGVTGFFGNCLKIAFENGIPTSSGDIKNYPGLYNKDTNPLGWYSYKIVVKQQEQEYYNVYLPGAMSGNVIYTETDEELNYEDVYNTTNISLFGDNINKIPKDTSNISPTDKMFGSDTFLYYRVIQVSWDENNKWNNISNDLVTPIDVVNIQSWNDYAPWTTKKGAQIAYPGGVSGGANGNINPIFNADKNPFIATLDISSYVPVGTEIVGRIGFAAVNQNNTSGANSAQFAKALMIAETNPVKSDLDIYWESSTSGLISDLNTSIATDSSTNSPDDITPWMFVYNEQYPYDGIGVYPAPYFGKFFLQQEIAITTNGGTVSSNPDAEITIRSVKSTNTAISGGDVTSFFTLEQTKTVSGGDPNNAWNIKFSGVDASNNSANLGSWVNGIQTGSPISNALEGLLTFELDLKIPGETPSVVTKSIRNNIITNEKPEWKYLVNPTWGVDIGLGLRPNPSNIDDFLGHDSALPISTNKLYPGYWTDTTVITTSNKMDLSPFEPLRNSDTGTVNASATEWSEGRAALYSMSLTGKDTYLSTFPYMPATDVTLFKKKSSISNKWVPSIERTSKPWNENAAIMFNYEGTDPTQKAALECPQTKLWFNNGSWSESDQSVIPYIKNVELSTWSTSGIKNNWEQFKLRGTLGVNGPQQGGTSTYGYPKWPFDVKKIEQSDILWAGDINDMDTSAYYLMIDPYNPPFNQFGSTDIYGNFEPEGDMRNKIRDLLFYCVYRITIGLKEDFAGGQDAGNDMTVYIKLYR